MEQNFPIWIALGKKMEMDFSNICNILNIQSLLQLRLFPNIFKATKRNGTNIISLNTQKLARNSKHFNFRH